MKKLALILPILLFTLLFTLKTQAAHFDVWNHTDVDTIHASVGTWGLCWSYNINKNDYEPYTAGTILCQSVDSVVISNNKTGEIMCENDSVDLGGPASKRVTMDVAGTNGNYYCNVSY